MKRKTSKSNLFELDRAERDAIDDVLEARANLELLLKSREAMPADIEEAQAEVDAVEETLTELSSSVTQKLENYGKFIKNLEVLKKGKEEQIRQFTAQKNSIARTIEWLKERLLNYLNQHGLEKVEANTFRIAKRFNAPSVVIEIPLEDLPKDFQRITVEADKTALRTAIQNNEDYPEGVFLVRKERVDIRVK